MGEALPLQVTYTNRSEQPIVFRQPEKTWSVFLDVRTRDEPEGEELPLGKRFYREVEPGFVRITVEEADEITLEADQVYRFDDDLAARWPEIFIPGDYTFRIADRSDDADLAFSNTLTLRVLFAQETVPTLLTMVADTAQTPFYRNWAASWLRQLKSDFEVQLPEEGEMESAEEAAFNTLAVQRFTVWWTSAQRSTQVADAIARINAAHIDEPE